MLGDLGVSTLRSIKTVTQFSSLFGASNRHAACFNARGLHYECVFDALLSSSSYRPVGKPVLITLLLDLFFVLLFSIIILAILPAMMLGYYS
jgi:ABC-type transport system involved in multi-copper enzyme maturation permease subunit